MCVYLWAYMFVCVCVVGISVPCVWMPVEARKLPGPLEWRYRKLRAPLHRYRELNSGLWKTVRS